MTAYPGCAGLARSPFVLTEHISSIKTIFSLRASEASVTYKFELVRYVYTYMYGGTCGIIVAHATHT